MIKLVCESTVPEAMRKKMSHIAALVQAVFRFKIPSSACPCKVSITTIIWKITIPSASDDGGYSE